MEKMMNSNDEIDLFDLVDDVKDNIGWLIAPVGAGVLAAAAYLFFSAPVYQAEVVLKPSNAIELFELNRPVVKDALGGGHEFLTEKGAFGMVRSEIRSGRNLLDYFKVITTSGGDKQKEYFDENISFEQNLTRFKDGFSFTDPGAKETDQYLRVSVKGKSPDMVALLANEYVSMAINVTKNDIRTSVESIIESRIDLLKQNADELREKYIAEKERKLRNMGEAAEIAKSIGQARPLYDAERVSVGTQPPLYMMGETVLRREIDLLNARAETGNEDKYIAGLPELEWKIKTLAAVSIDWGRVSVVKVDQDATPPISPIKPRPALVMALAVVAGGMAGVMLSLLSAAVKRRKAKAA